MSKIFFLYYMINRRVRDLSFHHYLGYFSQKWGHARITPPPPTKNFRLSCTVSTQDAYYIADTRSMFFTRYKSLPYLSTEDVFL